MTLRQARHAGVHGRPPSRALPLSFTNKTLRWFRGCVSARGAVHCGVITLVPAHILHGSYLHSPARALSLSLFLPCLAVACLARSLPFLSPHASATRRAHVRDIHAQAGHNALQHMSLKHTTRKFFLGTEILGTMPTMPIILPILLATLSATGPIILRPSGALLPTSEAFSPTIRQGHYTQPWSAVCNHSSEALLPTSEAFLSPFGVCTPSVRCAPYLGTIIQ